MFQQFQNIDSAFKNIRVFAIVFLIVAASIALFTVYRTTQTLQKSQQKVYILFNGKLLDAMAIDRVDSLSVEIRDHVKMFHYYFYSLQPDEEINKKHMLSALYLADNSARQEYNNLQENGYYSGVISANITQLVPDYDSIQIDITHQPIRFKYFGKLKLIRSTSILTRSLITEGYIRTTINNRPIQAISDHNPHGFIIEGWKVLENQDLTSEKR